jgi:hypothetical protein
MLVNQDPILRYQVELNAEIDRGADPEQLGEMGHGLPETADSPDPSAQSLGAKVVASETAASPKTDASSEQLVKPSTPRASSKRPRLSTRGWAIAYGRGDPDDPNSW